MKERSFCEGKEDEVVVISGSWRAGNGHPDIGSTPISLSLSTDWLRLPTAATLPNDRLATGAISTSGRATSGSGLEASPEYLYGFPRYLLPWHGSPGSDCERRVIPVDLGWATTSGRPVSASGGTVPESNDAAWVDGVSALLVGATKPGFSMEKA